MFGRKKEPFEEAQTEGIPVLCLFRKEDGVWNAMAAHLPVAAFGDTFEEAQQNLCAAITSHVESVAETGDIDKLFADLKKRADDHMHVTEIKRDSFVGKLAVTREMACV
ncbi:MAG: type II toxin-antitoxin system HicB family antitoxin [Candidatus Acidiferrales bacterium]